MSHQITDRDARIKLLKELFRPIKRVKVPSILQMESAECGAASLSMLLATYDRHVSLEELRVECGVSRNGSKASNIIKAARHYGLDGKGYRYEPEDLVDLEMPVILFWNFNHYLVLEGFGKGYVYLNDPSFGRRRVTVEEFDESFTGVVLVFKPGEDFQTGGERITIFGSLSKRLEGMKGTLAFLMITTCFLALSGLVIPLFAKVFVDYILVGGIHDWTGPLILGMCLTAVVRGILLWLKMHCLLRAEMKLALATSSRFFWRLLRLPISFFQQRFAGEIGTRIAVNDVVAKLLAGPLTEAILSMISLVFFAAVMARFDLFLTILGILIAAANLLVLRFLSGEMMRESLRLFRERGVLTGLSMSGLQMIETLKAMGSESEFFKRWTGLQARISNSELRLEAYNQVLATAPPVLATITHALILGVGGFRVMNGDLSPGDLVALQSLMVSFMAPVHKLIDFADDMQEVKVDLIRLDDVSNNKPDPILVSSELDSAAIPYSKFNGRIEFCNVTFGYDHLAPPLISNFNLVLNPGDRVALVGSTGCGKSTLVKLVSGLFPPWEGEILIDGIPLHRIPRRILANSMNLVDQDLFFFEGTIKDNLTLWDETISERELIDAAEDACIHEVIAARPGGYYSIVEEGGRNFSGSQRQQLEIARALVRNPRILLLDEATSALDPHVECQIDDNIGRRGCTSLIVAHRLRTIRDCDAIVVMEQGTVVRAGTFEEVEDLMRERFTNIPSV